MSIHVLNVQEMSIALGVKYVHQEVLPMKNVTKKEIANAIRHQSIVSQIMTVKTGLGTPPTVDVFICQDIMEEHAQDPMFHQKIKVPDIYINIQCL